MILFRIHLFAFFLSTTLSLSGQCPSASFTSPTQICSNQNIQLQNSSSNLVNYSWDFCDGSLENIPTAMSFGSANSSNAFDIATVADQGVYYSFVVNKGNNRLLRFNYGNSINSNPTETNLGNLGVLNSPGGISLWEEAGNKYALVSQNDGSLYLLKFGNSYANSPAINLVLTSTVIDLRHLKIFFEMGNVIALIAGGGGSGIILRLDFGTSILNTPMTSSAPVSNGIYLTGIEINQTCAKTYVVVSGYSSGIHILDYGSSTANNPTLINTLSSVPSPLGLSLKMSKGSLLLFVAGGSGISLLNFGSSITNNPSSMVYGTFGVLNLCIDFEIFEVGSKFYAFSPNYSDQNFTVFDFPKPCAVSGNFKNQPTPSPSYPSSGSFYITLNGANSWGISSYYTTLVTVSSLTSAQLGLNHSNDCMQFNFNSTISSGDVISNTWDFGDGNTSTQSSPVYTYISAATYYPTLTVASSNGCSNIFRDTVEVFNTPQPNFSLPLVSPLCTNQNYLFTNTSTSDAGSNPAWQWSINGSNVSTTQDLNYLFTSSASQAVTLTVTIPGCTVQSTQNITTLVGPFISFSGPSSGCQGSSFLFTNTTTDPITNFSWAFGDGNSSSQTNGSNVYNSPGGFAVILSGTSSNGCQNSFSKNITIYSLPQPNFTVEAPPCERWPSQFDNQTPTLLDSNISSWLWDFGDGGSSTLKNPAHVYATAGNNYNVSLKATSNFGCTNTFNKSVSILPSPVANFTNLPACINQSTQFNDASQGNVSFYQWAIEKAILSIPNPSYTFTSSKSFPVTLTVTASNGCFDKVTKNVIVPAKPLIDFSIEAPCTGHPSIIKEVNPGGTDPATFWNWSYKWDSGQDSGVGSPTTYQFPAEGSYQVIMSTTRQSGCVYSTSKNIYISPGPTAAFTPSVYGGTAPLDVAFTNTSVGDSFLWQFDDSLQTTSTTTSPEFIFNHSGNYKVLLTAYNVLGCSDTLSTTIDVVKVANIDVVMEELSLSNDPISTSSNPVVTILNSGNIPLVNPEVLIGFGGEASVKQKVTGLIRPGKSLVQTLGLQIVPQSLQYMCAEIVAPGDVNPFNNRQCVALTGEDVVLAPYPNPASSGIVTVQWIGATQENVKITIYKSDGEIAFQQELNEFQSGLGQMTINTSSFNNGLYLVQFSSSKTSTTFRVVIAN